MLFSLVLGWKSAGDSFIVTIFGDFNPSLSPSVLGEIIQDAVLFLQSNPVLWYFSLFLELYPIFSILTSKSGSRGGQILGIFGSFERSRSSVNDSCTFCRSSEFTSFHFWFLIRSLDSFISDRSEW